MREFMKMLEGYVAESDDDTMIGEYNVSIEPNEDREGVNCWIECEGYSASLAAAEDNGVLYKGDAERPISNRALDAIRRYAESKGY